MASADFDILGRLHVDTSELQRSVDGIGKNFSNLAKMASGALAGIGIASLGKAAIGVAADFEQTTIAFNTMLGSGEKASAFLKDLRQFAATTPFEFPELTQAASSLASVGIETEKIIPIMTTLGNTTAGMGTGAEGVKRATVALQQMNAAGRITGEDLNQLRDAGVPVYDLLAAATGKSKEEVTALAQAGKLGRKELDQLMKALETGKGLERFAGLMEKQSHTLKGVISTLQDTLKGAAIDFVTPHLPAMTAGLLKLADLLTNVLIPALNQAVTAFAAGWSDKETGDNLNDLQQAFLLLGDSMRFLVDVGSAVAGFLADNASVTIRVTEAVLASVVAYKSFRLALDIADAVNKTTNDIAKIAKATKNAAGEMVKFGQAVAGLPSKTVNLGLDGAQKVLDGVGKVRDGLTKLRDETWYVTMEYKEKKENAAAEAGKNTAKGFINGFGATIAGGLGGALLGNIGWKAIGATVIRGLGTALLGVGSAIAAVVTSPVFLIALGIAAAAAAGLLIWHFRKPITEFFAHTLPEFLGNALETALDFGAKLLDKGRELVGKLKEGIETGAANLLQFFIDLPYNIAYALGFALGTLVRVGIDLITGIFSGIQTMWTTVSTWFTELPGRILELFGDVTVWLNTTGISMITGLWNGISGFWTETVLPFFSNLSVTIGEAIGDAIGWLVDTGRKILSGLWEGIQFAWRDPKGFFLSLRGVVIGFLGDTLGWLIDKGRDILGGLWRGLTQGWADSVVPFLRNLPGEIIAMFGNAKEWLLDAGGAIIDGLLSGLTGSWHKITSWVGNAGSWFKKGFNDAIDAKSPAKIMFGPGANVVSGIIVGMESMEAALARQVKDVAAIATSMDLANNVVTNAPALNALQPSALNAVGTGRGQIVNIGDINLYGVADADGVRGVIPELTDALRAAVGTR